MSKKEYVLDSLFEDLREGIPKEDYNESWYEHKEQVRNLLKKGLYGFIGGTLIFGLMELLSSPASNNPGPLAFGEMWPIILISVIAGIACIGFPLGWELLNRLVGQWSIWGNLFIVVTLFVFKLAFALMIGVFAYPILLIYHIIKSQKSKRKVRLWTIIVISVVVLWYVFLGIFAIVVERTDSGSNNIASTTAPAVQHYATAEEIPMDVVQEIAAQLVAAKQAENDSDTNFTYTDVELYGIFFMTSREGAWADENQLHFVIHYDMLETDGSIRFSNYIPFYIKDIIVAVDGTVTISSEDCSSPTSYDTAEDYLERYEENYDITKIG